MEKNLTTIQRIKQMLELDKVKFSFAETTTSGGVVVRTEGDFEIGKEVFVVGEDGTETPAPDGQHILPELGIVIETEGGVCTEISDMVEEEQSEVEVEASVSPEEQTAIITEVMNILEPRFEEMNRIHAEIMKRIDEMEAKMNDGQTASEEMKNQLEKLSKAPGDKSKTTIDEYKKQVKSTFEDKIQKLRSIKRK